MPIVSVIVPVYNVEKYIHRCVDSILAQTFTDFELILVDDGSPDNCPAICDEYAESDSRVIVIHQENQGQSAARNNAVALARGEWIHFVDSDDLIHPQMLEILYKAVIETGANISMCTAVEAQTIPDDFYRERNPKVKKIKIDESAFEWLAEYGEYRNCVVWGKLIRKVIVKEMPMENGRIYEDSAVVCPWFHFAGMIADVDERLYFYMVNSEGTTKSNFNLKRLDSLWAREEQIKFYEKLDYRRMLTRLCGGYMIASADLVKKVREELKKPAIAINVGIRLFYVWRKYRTYIHLTNEQKEYVCGCLWPKATRVFSYCRAGINTLRVQGFQGVWKKIRNKFTK